MAEAYIRDNHEGLPLAMHRPAIVVSTYREPIKGWIDNYYGPTGVCAGVMMGVLHIMHCDDEVNANIVPVDMCVNSMIAAAWEVGIKFKKNKKMAPLIYNYVSAVEKPITWSEYNRINMVYGMKYPLKNSVFSIHFTTQKSGFKSKLYMVFLHFLPALVIDVLTVLTGRTPRMINLNKKIYKFLEVISYFSTNEWKFNNDNVKKLYKNMDERDKEIFNFDMNKLDWLDYFKSYVLGIREHLFKEELSTLEEGKKKQHRLVYLTIISAHLSTNYVYEYAYSI